MIHTNRLMISHPNLCLDETESVQTPLRVYSNALEIERCPVENLVIYRFSFFPWAQLKVGKCAGVGGEAEAGQARDDGQQTFLP